MTIKNTGNLGRDKKKALSVCIFDYVLKTNELNEVVKVKTIISLISRNDSEYDKLMELINPNKENIYGEICYEICQATKLRDCNWFYVHEFITLAVLCLCRYQIDVAKKFMSIIDN